MARLLARADVVLRKRWLLLVVQRVARCRIHLLGERHVLRVLVCGLEVANHVVVAAGTARLKASALTSLAVVLILRVLGEAIVSRHAALLGRLILIYLNCLSCHVANLLLILSQL